VPSGWQRQRRPSVIHPPAHSPKRSSAASQYWEQVGTCLQWMPMSGESVERYKNTMPRPIRRGMSLKCRRNPYDAIASTRAANLSCWSLVTGMVRCLGVPSKPAGRKKGSITARLSRASLRFDRSPRPPRQTSTWWRRAAPCSRVPAQGPRCRPICRRGGCHFP